MLKWLGSSRHSAPQDAMPAEPESPSASLLVPWSEVAQGTALTSVFETDQSSTGGPQGPQNQCDGHLPAGHQTSNSQLNEGRGMDAPWPPIPIWFWVGLAALTLYDLYLYRASSPIMETLQWLEHLLLKFQQWTTSWL